MKLAIQILCLILSISWALASISGLSYQDPIPQKPLPGEDPCNPLYWYPRSIPEYCNNKIISSVPAPLPKPPPYSSPLPPIIPIPMPPIAIPMPSYPAPMPILPPMPVFPLTPQFIPPMAPSFGIPPPYGPIAPMNPYSVPYPYSPMLPSKSQVGYVPGIQGLVSSDGGINILPFSDAYTDMLEKHKQKMIRQRLQKVLDDYDDSPRRRKYKKFRKRRGRYLSYEE